MLSHVKDDSHVVGVASQWNVGVDYLMLNARTPCSRRRTAVHNQNMANPSIATNTNESLL